MIFNGLRMEHKWLGQRRAVPNVELGKYITDHYTNYNEIPFFTELSTNTHGILVDGVFMYPEK